MARFSALEVNLSATSSPTASTQGLVDVNPFIFRNALTREIQAKFLAEYSVNTLHLRRFAVLHPFEPFGLELKDIFIREDHDSRELLPKRALTIHKARILGISFLFYGISL